MAHHRPLIVLLAIVAIAEIAEAHGAPTLFFKNFEKLPQKCKHSLAHFERKISENERGEMFIEFAKNVNNQYELHKNQIPERF